jgi:hypothetical protein
MIKTKRYLIAAPFLLLTAYCSLLTAQAQSGGLKGKVRTNSGRGIANATVAVRRDGRDVKTVTSDAKGNFTMQGLDPGRYNVVFNADGYASGVLYNVEVKNKSTRDLGERLILSVDPGSQVIVRGSVFFKEGTSVTGAEIEIERVNPDGSAKRVGSAYTNISGEFSFRQPQGAAKLRINAKYKGVSGTKEVEVDSAAIYRLAITLEISRNDK